MARWSWTKQGARNGMNRKKRRAKARMIREMVARIRPVSIPFEDYSRHVDEEILRILHRIRESGT